MFDIITIGTATRDVILKSDFLKVVHDEKYLKKLGFPTGEAECLPLGGKVEVSAVTLETGGGATNAAVTFARQGFKTASLFEIGRDVSGEAIIADLKKEKVFSFPIYDKKKGTAYSTLLLSPSGERTVLVYRGASEDLEIKEVPFSKLKSRWAYIVPGGIKFSVMSKIVSKMYKEGTLMAINPSKIYIQMGLKKLKPLLDQMTVVILNREEAAYLTGLDYAKEEEIFKKLDEAISGILVVTDGPHGVRVSDGEKIYKAGTFKERVIADRTGAGDSFGSGFVAGLMRSQIEKSKSHAYRQAGKIIKFGEKQIDYAIRLGSANATSNVEIIGAKSGIITRSEFEKSKRWKKLPVEIKKV